MAQKTLEGFEKTNVPRRAWSMLRRLRDFANYSSLMQNGIQTSLNPNGKRTYNFIPITPHDKDDEENKQVLVAERTMKKDARLIEKCAQAFTPEWKAEEVGRRDFSRFFERA